MPVLFAAAAEAAAAAGLGPGEIDVSSSSLIGVAISCGGNVLISLALTLQKLAHKRQDRKSSSPDTSPSSSSHSTSPKIRATSSSTDPNLVPIIVVPQAQATPPNSSSDEERIQWRDAFAPVVDDGNPSTGGKKHYLGRKVDANGNDLHVRLQSPVIEQSPTRVDVGEDGGVDGVIGVRGNREGENPDGEEDDEEDEDDEAEEGEGEGEEEESAKVGEGAYLKSKLWWLGLILMAVGEGGNFLSYGFAPASVVAPLGTVALIANCAFAPLILKESFTKRNFVGMGLSIVGAVTVVWSSNESNPRLSPDQLVSAITQIPFLVYTSLVVLLLIPLILLSSRDRWGGRFIGIDVGICALFGGYTVMATKALSSLLSTMFLASLEYPVTWLAIAVLVATSVFQIQYLNRALMRFDSKEVIPTQFVFFSMSAIVGSAVLYQEFRGVPFSHFVNFAFGIATTFSGVYFLTTPPAPSPPSSSPSSPAAAPSHTAPTGSTLAPLATLDETTPLLISPRDSGSSLVRTVSAVSGSSGVVTATLVPARAARLMTRSSSGNLTLAPPGLGSQAGLLLLATTPPTAGFVAGDGVGRGLGDGVVAGLGLGRARARSGSRGSRSVGSVGDEESQRGGRRSRRSSQAQSSRRGE